MSVHGFDHYIQRDIFMKLRQCDEARYSELVIKTIEPSQFVYHLKELIRMGVVEKIDKGRYRLSREGIKISQNFSGSTRNITVAPLTYNLIFARSVKGRWLVLERRKQPYFNMLGCISGKVHMEETLIEARDREWREFTTQPIPEFEYEGYTSVLIKQDNEVLTHIAGSVWFADKVEEVWSNREAIHGLLQWVDWRSIDYKKFIPGWKELIKPIELNEPPFILDLSFNL